MVMFYVHVIYLKCRQKHCNRFLESHYHIRQTMSDKKRKFFIGDKNFVQQNIYSGEKFCPKQKF